MSQGRVHLNSQRMPVKFISVGSSVTDPETRDQHHQFADKINSQLLKKQMPWEF